MGHQAKLSSESIRRNRVMQWQLPKAAVAVRCAVRCLRCRHGRSSWRPRRTVGCGGRRIEPKKSNSSQPRSIGSSQASRARSGRLRRRILGGHLGPGLCSAPACRLGWPYRLRYRKALRLTFGLRLPTGCTCSNSRKYLVSRLTHPNLRSVSYWPRQVGAPLRTEVVEYACRGLFPRRADLRLNAYPQRV